MAETGTKQEPTRKRVVGIASVVYYQQSAHRVPGAPPRHPVTATHGQEIYLTEDEEQRLEKLGALTPVDSTPEDADRAHGARVDAYRRDRAGS